VDLNVHINMLNNMSGFCPFCV